MPDPIVIVHGWSDKADSFSYLADFLRKELKTQVSTIDLADWVSLNDEITYRDLRAAMQRAWAEHPKIKSAKSASIVSHSTGALVVRDWMTEYYTPATVPVRRHLMLAPANFGSPLAHKGRAWYGRVFKGWKTGFQTGGHLLKGLELASDYSWKLAARDLFTIGDKNRWYGPDRILACVLVGNSGYGGVKEVTDEVGSDGTVRVSTANLRAARVCLSVPAKGGTYIAPKLEHPNGGEHLAFGISPGDDHGSIAFKNGRVHRPKAPDTPKWIVEALTRKPEQWGEFVASLDAANQRIQPGDDSYFNHYQNTVVRLRDTIGNPVEDYLVEFHQGGSRSLRQRLIGFFQREVIYSVHAYSSDSSIRSFYMDTTLLSRQLDDAQNVVVEFEALPEYRSGRAVGYPALQPVELSRKLSNELFAGHRTVLVDIEVPRTIGKEAFVLKRHSG